MDIISGNVTTTQEISGEVSLIKSVSGEATLLQATLRHLCSHHGPFVPSNGQLPWSLRQSYHHAQGFLVL